MKYQNITVCPVCGHREYISHLCFLGSRKVCRVCYRQAYQREKGRAYPGHWLDGSRPDDPPEEQFNRIGAALEARLASL